VFENLYVVEYSQKIHHCGKYVKHDVPTLSVALGWLGDDELLF
jgi:hypothetical protein